MKKLISISLAPNLTKQDSIIAWRYLLLPWKWLFCKSGKYLRQAQVRLANILKANPDDIFLLNSGRSGLFMLLQTLALEPDDEVILQAYTCVVVPNTIQWNNAKPIYVDIHPDSQTMDIEDLKRKITPKTKAIIVQHSFGLSAKLDDILELAKEHNIFVIEDCATNLGGKYKDKPVGTWGHAAIFSFGRDKVVSTVGGGAVLLNKVNNEFKNKFKASYKKIPTPSYSWVVQNLVHLALMPIIKKTYYWFGLGKIILWLTQKLKFTNKAYQACELNYEQPADVPARYANALANVLLNQLNLLPEFITHRQRIAGIYNEKFKGIDGITIPKQHIDREHTYLRYLILVDHPKMIYKQARQQGILLDFWYNKVIVPITVDTNKIGYQNDCPVAERLAPQSLNLPTFFDVSAAEAMYIADLVIKSVAKQ